MLRTFSVEARVPIVLQQDLAGIISTLVRAFFPAALLFYLVLSFCEKPQYDSQQSTAQPLSPHAEHLYIFQQGTRFSPSAAHQQTIRNPQKLSQERKTHAVKAESLQRSEEEMRAQRVTLWKTLLWRWRLRAPVVGTRRRFGASLYVHQT